MKESKSKLQFRGAFERNWKRLEPFELRHLLDSVSPTALDAVADSFFRGREFHKDTNHFSECRRCAEVEAKLTAKDLLCPDCGWNGDEYELGCELESVEDLGQRLSPGERVPYGECPVCEALVHKIGKED